VEDGKGVPNPMPTPFPVPVGKKGGFEKAVPLPPIF